jgi:CheY-like chemotaxis protein
MRETPGRVLRPLSRQVGVEAHQGVDDEELREMMRDALDLNGYTVVTAEHGADALAKLATNDICASCCCAHLRGRTGARGRRARDSKAVDVRSPAIDRSRILRPVDAFARSN